jgi:flagellar basal body-associated protein FliL
MDSNKKLIIIIVTIVAVGLAIVMGVRAFTGQGRVDTAEGQKAIQEAVSRKMDPSQIETVRQQDRRAPSGIGRLPGNKGGQAAPPSPGG